MNLTSAIKVTTGPISFRAALEISHYARRTSLDFEHIRFWPFMAETFVDVVFKGVNYICGDIIYAARYARTRKLLENDSIKPTQVDQSIRDLYGYRGGARRIHWFRMHVQVYFGVPPIATNASGSRRSKSHRITKAQLREMVCHEGKWYADQDELKKALEDTCYRAQDVPWTLPNWMLQPPRSKRKRATKRR
jgi:hypothetical protein